MNTVNGKFALITGGTQGLGASIARLFARANAAGIVIVGRDSDKGIKVAQDITRDSGVPVDMVTADLADMQAVSGIVPAVEKRFGRVDVLINAAG